MDDGVDPETLAARKRASVVQVLFRVARRLDALALARVRQATGMPVRPAHTALFPHIDLDGTRLTVIAERAGISKQAVGQLVDDLVAMGALERVPDPADGRARLVRFVGGGSALLHGLSVLGALESDLAGIVGGDALAAMHATLQAVDDALDAGTLTPGEGTG